MTNRTEASGPDLERWERPDHDRMAEFTVALDALAREHGFRLEASLKVVQTPKSYPRLQLSFLQFEESAAQQTQRQSAQGIRAFFQAARVAMTDDR